MSYPTMCCEVEEKRNVPVVAGEEETPLASIMTDTNKELHEARMTLQQIIIRLINAPAPEDDAKPVSCLTEEIQVANRQAYDCRCLSRRIEQLLFGNSIG